MLLICISLWIKYIKHLLNFQSLVSIIYKTRTLTQSIITIFGKRGFIFFMFITFCGGGVSIPLHMSAVRPLLPCGFPRKPHWKLSRGLTILKWLLYVSSKLLWELSPFLNIKTQPFKNVYDSSDFNRCLLKDFKGSKNEWMFIRYFIF